MTRRVHCIGDKNDGNGIINITSQSKCFYESRLIANTGSFGTTHDAGTIDNGYDSLGLPGVSDGNSHNQNIWITLGNAGSRVFIDGKPMVAEGDVDSCFHTRVGGASKLFIG